jgi:hypothetical protein
MFPPYFNAPRKRPRSSPREQVLADWRRVNLTAQETAHAVSSKSAGDILPTVLKDLRMERRQSETEILKVWNHLMDPNVTAHAQPTGINKGTLFVTVDSSVWLDEIVRYRRREILQRLQHSFGKEMITRISFRVG